MDAKGVMQEAKNISQQALADFFTAMTAQKAYWYRITSGSWSDFLCSLINQVFPLMTTLLSNGPEVMHAMLQKCGLCFERKGAFSPQMNSWQTFIAEYRVDVEVTTFSILNKRRYFIRNGSWDKKQYHPKLPLT